MSPLYPTTHVLVDWALAIAAIAAAGVYGTVGVTLLTDLRFWPPGDADWKRRLHWTFVTAYTIAMAVVAVADWNGWMLARPISLAVGAPIALAGGAVFHRGANAMRTAEVAGVTGDLYTDGPYAYSRNPQYVGIVLGMLGATLAVNSAVFALLAALHVGWVLLLPIAEEPHLRSAYGEEYDRYAERVPRFVGRETLRRLGREIAAADSRATSE